MDCGEASSRTHFRSKVETWLFSQPAMALVSLVSEKMKTGDSGGGERRGGGRGYGVSLSFSLPPPLPLAPPVPVQKSRNHFLFKLPKEGIHFHSW